MGIALDAVRDGTGVGFEHHWFGYIVAALLPTPTHSGDPGIDGNLTSNSRTMAHLGEPPSPRRERSAGQEPAVGSGWEAGHRPGEVVVVEEA